MIGPEAEKVSLYHGAGGCGVVEERTEDSALVYFVDGVKVWCALKNLTPCRHSHGGFKVASQNRRALRAAIQAAAPHMLKAVWDEAYGKGFEAGRGEPDAPNPYEVAK